MTLPLKPRPSFSIPLQGSEPTVHLARITANLRCLPQLQTTSLWLSMFISQTWMQFPGGKLDRNKLVDILHFFVVDFFEEGEKTAVFSLQDWGIFLWIKCDTFGVCPVFASVHWWCLYYCALHLLQYLSFAMQYNIPGSTPSFISSLFLMDI